MSSDQIKNSRVHRDARFDNLNVTAPVLTASTSPTIAKAIQLGQSGVSGSATIYPSTAQRGKVVISATNNSANYTTTITNAAQGAAYTYTIPDAGASAEFVMTAGDQAITGEPSFAVGALSPLQRFTLLDDFFGTWAIGDAGPADRWSSTAGSGTGNAVATTVANSLCGEITIKSASDDGAHGANASNLTGINLGFKANRGGLMMEARLKIDAITDVALFVGFTDTISTTVEMPIFLNAADLDSDATDACGVGYDTDGTTDQFFHGGVKAGTDTTPAYSGSAPVADTYFTVRVEVSAAGAVTGYIDGTAIGTAVANAVTITTALTPCLVICNRGAAQRVMTVDYVYVQMDR